jgi:hypothetical protein
MRTPLAVILRWGTYGKLRQDLVQIAAILMKFGADPTIGKDNVSIYTSADACYPVIAMLNHFTLCLVLVSPYNLPRSNSILKKLLPKDLIKSVSAMLFDQYQLVNSFPQGNV